MVQDMCVRWQDLKRVPPWPSSRWSQGVVKALARRPVMGFPGMATTFFMVCFRGLHCFFRFGSCLHLCMTGKGDNSFWKPSSLFAQFKRKKYAWTWFSHNILQTTSTNGEMLYLLRTHPKVGGVYPEDGPNSQHGLECWQLSNFFMCLFSLNPFVSDCNWRWHTQHWPSI